MEEKKKTEDYVTITKRYFTLTCSNGKDLKGITEYLDSKYAYKCAMMDFTAVLTHDFVKTMDVFFSHVETAIVCTGYEVKGMSQEYVIE